MYRYNGRIKIKFFPADEKTFLQKSFETSGTTEVMHAFNEHLVSIDPDSHSIEEFDNTKYGVLVAQKGMVTSKDNLSSFSLTEFEQFLKNRKKKWRREN